MTTSRFVVIHQWQIIITQRLSNNENSGLKCNLNKCLPPSGVHFLFDSNTKFQLLVATVKERQNFYPSNFPKTKDGFNATEIPCLFNTIFSSSGQMTIIMIFKMVSLSTNINSGFRVAVSFWNKGRLKYHNPTAKLDFLGKWPIFDNKITSTRFAADGHLGLWRKIQ